MQVAVKNMQGQEVGTVELSDAIFAAEVNTSLMHQALVRQLANKRLGTHKTKTRSETRGGGAKPWRQKGTGRARQGSIRAPHWKGGGVVFAPRPRSYRKQMPRKMRRAALRSALSLKAGAEQIVVLDGLQLEQPRTRSVVEMLAALNTGRNTLLLLPETNPNVELSVRNLPNVKILRVNYLNIRDLLGFETLIMLQQSLTVIESFLADGRKETEE
ncbi:MAG: 50S ribosomal protein L4 [Chloroflexi bacterium]|nr:50S ribosomal protein L4 [Chloroflexota bacterium]